MRINKYLALCGFGSRRKTEELVKAKKVFINENLCIDLAYNVNEEIDKVKVAGRLAVMQNSLLYLMLNKPKGYIVSKEDEFHRKTAFELLPKFKENVFPIGRLDKESEGLLLFTSDGNFSNSLLHPKFKIPKVYKVKIKGRLSNEQLDNLRNGVLLYGKPTLPAKVFVRKNEREFSYLKITIFEGRKRQIREMLKIVGSEVLELKRLQIGFLKLGNLPKGMWRFLTPNEILSLIKFSQKK